MGWEDPLEKKTATHSSILAWKIPQTEEPGGQQSMELQRVRYNWAQKQNNKSLCEGCGCARNSPQTCFRYNLQSYSSSIGTSVPSPSSGQSLHPLGLIVSSQPSWPPGTLRPWTQHIVTDCPASQVSVFYTKLHIFLKTKTLFLHFCSPGT